MIKSSLRLLLFLCLGVSASLAANNPFVGDWKLNPSKSTLTDQMKVESVGANKYAFDFGGGPATLGRSFASRMAARRSRQSGVFLRTAIHSRITSRAPMPTGRPTP